jgi:hypothetical protein
VTIEVASDRHDGEHGRTGDRVHDGRELSRPSVLVLWYALTGGVAWWAFHLVGLSVLEQWVCHGVPRWTLTLINVVSALGVVTALVASVAVRRFTTPGARVTRWPSFMGALAVLFNAISLALVVLESVPVYVLGSCG